MMNNSPRHWSNWRKPLATTDIRRNAICTRTRMKSTFRIICIAALLLTTFGTAAQETTRILFVFDASNSMNGFWEKKRKIETATELLSQSLDNLRGKENLELGLRVYGHQTKHVPGAQDCEDTELVVSIGSGRDLIIQKELTRITPQGTTPIAYSLEQAANDFEPCSDCRNIIILITDGIEACDGDPCAISRALQRNNVILKPFVIGIGIDERYTSTFECVGNYYDASKEETFKSILDIVISQALNNTSAQINLLNINDKPLETNVPLTIRNEQTGEVIYHFIHTLNHKGNPDTLTLDPLITYDITAHTLPPVRATGLTVEPGTHNILPLSTPQGDLAFSFDRGLNEYADLKVLVKRGGSCELVNIQDWDQKERYLVGEYDLEIQTVPPTRIPDVAIAQSHTTDIKVPLPGALLLQTGASGFGAIFRVEGNTFEPVVHFNHREPSGRYIMQPGKYKLVFRSRNSQQTAYTKEKDFEITSGRNTTVNL